MQKIKRKITVRKRKDPMNEQSNAVSTAMNAVGRVVLKGLGALGEGFNTVLTSGATTDFGQTSPFVMSSYNERRNIQKAREQFRQKSKEKISQGSIWISPVNYGSALLTGNGLNAEKGAEEFSKLPEWTQALGRAAELYVTPKIGKSIKNAPKTVVNTVVDTAARAGNKTAKATSVARRINKAVKDSNATTYKNPNFATVVTEQPQKVVNRQRYNLAKSNNGKIFDLYEGAFPIKMNEPFMYDALSNDFIPNKNYYYRRGWGIIDDAIESGKIRVPEGDYKSAALQKYPWLDNGNPFSTALMNHKFPYFSEGKLWNAMGKFGVEPEDLIAVPKDTPGVLWVGGSKYGNLLRDKTPSEVGGRATPLVNGETNNLPTLNNYLFKYNKNTKRYELVEAPLVTRPASKISLEERAGIPKGERNFTPKWHVANYPGYQLKGLMGGSPLEKQISKNGTININQLNAYFNKASQIEKEVANKVLSEKFAGQNVIDYNQFKKAVQDELITYKRVPQTKYAKYGMDRLGLTNKVEDQSLVLAGIPQNITLQEPLPGIKTNTFTFESPRISAGNNKHYDPTTLGHSRTYTTPEEPKVLHVMESQSDWAQKSLGLTKAEKTAIQNIDEQLKTGTPTGFSTLEELQVRKQAILDRASQRTQGISYQSQHLHDNYLQRQLQENLKYASEHGQTKMRYPTSETAAKIEGYSKTEQTPEFKEALAELERLQHLKTTNQMSKAERLQGIRQAVENNRLTSISDKINIETGETKYYTPEEKARLIRDAENKLADIQIQQRDFMYSPQHQTILKKYADFPKLFQKLFKDQKVRTVTDVKGNTWYEVDVPKGYLSREWKFKKGGKASYKFKNFILKKKKD